MPGVLDPTTPYPWLLYILAGAGVVAFALPRSINRSEPVVRDIYNAHAPARALCAVVYWALWPVVASLLVLEVAARIALWLIDLFDDDHEDDD